MVLEVSMVVVQLPETWENGPISSCHLHYCYSTCLMSKSNVVSQDPTAILHGLRREAPYSCWFAGDWKTSKLVNAHVHLPMACAMHSQTINTRQ